MTLTYDHELQQQLRMWAMGRRERGVRSYRSKMSIYVCTASSPNPRRAANPKQEEVERSSSNRSTKTQDQHSSDVPSERHDVVPMSIVSSGSLFSLMKTSPLVGCMALSTALMLPGSICSSKKASSYGHGRREVMLVDPR
jgi:hypothetical protein